MFRRELHRLRRVRDDLALEYYDVRAFVSLVLGRAGYTVLERVFRPARTADELAEDGKYAVLREELREFAAFGEFAVGLRGEPQRPLVLEDVGPGALEVRRPHRGGAEGGFARPPVFH